VDIGPVENDPVTIGPIAINANGDPARFAQYGLPVLPDGEFADQGPLAGVLAGLRWAAAEGAEVLLTVPGDTPFLPPQLAAMLAPAPACAMTEGQPHYLVALWPVAAVSALEAFLRTYKFRNVSRFAETIGMRYVDIPKRDPRWFVNVNTPDDLQRLEALHDSATTG
jgi:molybdopterin-guanine dinucleotide biosynthesis protein A